MEVGRYHRSRARMRLGGPVENSQTRDNIAGMFTKLWTLRPRKDFLASFKQRRQKPELSRANTRRHLPLLL